MKKIPSSLAIITFLLCTLLSIEANALNGQSTVVQGVFCSAQSGSPIPGLTVSLVHPELGRSAPAFTNENGYFQMINIPLTSTPYYIEVYWGSRLIYRSQIQVQGPLNLPMQCI